MDISTINKAIAGGLVSGAVAIAARYGFHADPVYSNALSVLVTGLVGYVAGHIVVWLSPANKPSLKP